MSFSSQHVIDISNLNSSDSLFINLLSIGRFSKNLLQGVPCKAKNWHALSHEQYFSKHSFLDICQCAFNCQAEWILYSLSKMFSTWNPFSNKWAESKIEWGCALWLVWSGEKKLMEIKRRVCCQFVSMLFGKKQGNELFFQSFRIPGLIPLNFTSLYRSRRWRVFHEKAF